MVLDLAIMQVVKFMKGNGSKANIKDQALLHSLQDRNLLAYFGRGEDGEKDISLLKIVE